MESQTDDKGASAGQGAPSAEKKIVATQDAVFDACEQLYLDAENITRDKVSNMIGGGSPVVVMRYINEWREHRASENRRKKSEFEIAFSKFGQKIEEMIAQRQADFESELIKKLGGQSRELFMDLVQPAIADQTHSAHTQPPASDPAPENSETSPTQAQPAITEHMPTADAEPAAEPAGAATRPDEAAKGSAFADAPEHGFIPDADQAIGPSPAEEEDEFFPPVADGDFELRPEDLLALGAAGAHPEADGISMEDIDAALAAGDESLTAAKSPTEGGSEQRPPAATSQQSQQNDGWRGISAPLI